MSAPTLQAAVKATPSIANEWRAGLQAVAAADHGFISLRKPRNCGGSVAIDEARRAAEPDAERWDYVVQQDGVVVFIEVHPADGDHHITKMVGKLKWLKEWLRTRAPLINALPRATKPFRWVHTGPNTLRIPPGSRYDLMMRQNGLSKPVEPLIL